MGETSASLSKEANPERLHAVGVQPLYILEKTKFWSQESSVLSRDGKGKINRQKREELGDETVYFLEAPQPSTFFTRLHS